MFGLDKHISMLETNSPSLPTPLLSTGRVSQPFIPPQTSTPTCPRATFPITDPIFPLTSRIKSVQFLKPTCRGCCVGLQFLHRAPPRAGTAAPRSSPPGKGSRGSLAPQNLSHGPKERGALLGRSLLSAERSSPFTPRSVSLFVFIFMFYFPDNSPKWDLTNTARYPR